MHEASGNQIYEEKISSNWTQALFVALFLIFGMLCVFRVRAHNSDLLGILFGCFAGLFLFYVVNYRTLIIRLTPERLVLKFGIFTWRVSLDNIDDCRLDDQIPPIVNYGGAGIHFIMYHQRYRVSFNFLEYPRVIVAFKKKVGPVKDISFTTKKPDEVIRLIRAAASVENDA
jgi:hypothetical protein